MLFIEITIVNVEAANVEPALCNTYPQLRGYLFEMKQALAWLFFPDNVRSIVYICTDGPTCHNLSVYVSPRLNSLCESSNNIINVLLLFVYSLRFKFVTFAPPLY